MTLKWTCPKGNALNQSVDGPETGLRPRRLLDSYWWLNENRASERNGKCSERWEKAVVRGGHSSTVATWILTAYQEAESTLWECRQGRNGQNRKLPLASMSPAFLPTSGGRGG